MKHLKKAELVEGIVHMPLPLSLKRHGQPHAVLCSWAVVYAAGMLGTQAGDSATVILDPSNELQPDVLLRILPENGGQTSDTEDEYVDGAPEFVGEVASSSASYDLHDKRTAYRRNGVREYLVWLTRENRLEWWALRDNEYVSLPSDANGVVRSEVFLGLWLDVPALLRGDVAAVLGKLKEGLESAEAATFKARLWDASRKT